MLNDLQLAAIIAKTTAKTQMVLLQIPLSQELQVKLEQDWSSQYDEFVNGIQEVDFDPGYKPDADERFCVAEYNLPEWLAEESSYTGDNHDTLSNNEARMNLIKGVVGFTRNENDEELMLFQRFTKSQVIQPGRFLLRELNTYKGIERPGLTLARKLSAIYQPEERKLVFDNFRNVNTFLPLADFYKEASDQEIIEVLNHERFVCEDKNTLATGANQWFRTRFAMLKDSGILDLFSAIEIQSRSRDYQITIQLTNDRKNIVFPTDKAEAKKLLQFLVEERFLGAFTGTLFETNSKKEVG